MIESFSHGRAAIVSTGGALPEVAGLLAPAVSIDDRDGWRTRLESWMAQSAERAMYEARIRSTFARPTWAFAADQFRQAALEDAS